MAWKLSCYTLPYKGTTPERAFEGIAQAGFQCATLGAMKSAPQIPVEQMSEGAISDLRSTLRRLGLNPVAIGAHHPMHTDEGKEWLRRRIDLAHALGSEIVDTGGAEMVPAEASAQEKREMALRQRLFFKNLRELAEYARERGVRIALETHGGLTGTAAMCVHTLRQIRSDNVGIAYDPANIIYYEDTDPAKDIERIADRVWHLHLKDFSGRKGDGQICDFGLGDVDYGTVFRKLREAGFDGPVSVERAAGETPEDVDANLAQIRERVLQAIERL